MEIKNETIEDTQNESETTNIQNDKKIISTGDINMYKQPRGRCCDTVIVGLIFNSNDTIKKFISSIKKKFGIGGCHKMMDNMDKLNKVFVFTGDSRDKITKILVEEYNYDSKLIKKFG